MTRRLLIAGNWKMNKTPSESEDFVRSILPAVDAGDEVDALILPPFTSLDRLGTILEGTPLALGAQDLHQNASGAFTGAISTQMLCACGCRYVLAGHSERRHVFGDSDDLVAAKLQAALAAGLEPILCIGERLDERRADETESVLERQLMSGLADISDPDLRRITIAYEPVWAIGTGETATPEQAQGACAFVRGWLLSAFGEEIAASTRILYGGSVKPANAQALLGEPDIDGALVGGASLAQDAFAAILKTARSLGGVT